MTDMLNFPLSLETLQAKRPAIMRLAARHGARNVRVFGSVARGEANPDSDIDFLVDFQPGASIWDMIGFWQDVSELLGCEVSVVTESTLEGEFKANALRDAVSL